MTNLNTTTGARQRSSIRALDYDEAPGLGFARKGASSRDFQLAYIKWLKRRGLYAGSTTEAACLKLEKRRAKQFKSK